MSMKRTILASVFSVLSLGLGAQQLPQHSAFNSAGFIWNPAMTAPWYVLEFGALHRQQWLSFEQAPQTSIAYGQFPFVDFSMSAGGFVVRDKVGPLQQTAVGLTYAYQLPLGSDGILALGILATLNQYRFNVYEALTSQPDDPLLLGADGSAFLPNAGAGIYYSTASGYNYDDNYFFLGVGVNQLLPRNLILGEANAHADFRREVHGNATIGGRFYQGYLFVEPSLWINYSPNLPLNFALQLNFELEEAFWGGLVYSNDGTIGVQGGAILTGSIFQDGYLRVGAMGTYNGGTSGRTPGLGYEFFLAYQFEL